MNNNNLKTRILLTCVISCFSGNEVLAVDFSEMLDKTLDVTNKVLSTAQKKINDLQNKETVVQKLNSAAPSVKKIDGKLPVVKKGKEIPYKITYEGYSKDFVVIRDHIANGKMALAYELEQKRIKSDGGGFLNSVEAGLLSVDTAHTIDGIEGFSQGEQYLKGLISRSVVEGGAMKYGRELLSVITGKGDMTEYSGEPYERILMLNYKSIAYLLEGERKAYNVTRRAIDWQNIERKKFEDGITEIAEQVVEVKKSKDNKKTMTFAPKAFNIILDQYKRHESKAKSVKSAYINPFGFYMAGIVQEFDSYYDASLRSNAKISYKKALELNPKSRVLKKTWNAMKTPPPRNRRLLHVIVADGFAPEKKTLSFNLAINGGLVQVKTPLFEPVKSSVRKIKIKSGKRVLATLSEVADIEAITLRHQLDMLPIEHAKVIASIGRNIGENMLWNQLGAWGMVGKLFRESIANPDMRSWMTLPKKVLAARLNVSKRLKKITIVSYDRRGRVLAKKNILLNKKSNNFIYARSLEKNMYAQVSKKLW